MSKKEKTSIREKMEDGKADILLKEEKMAVFVMALYMERHIRK